MKEVKIISESYQQARKRFFQNHAKRAEAKLNKHVEKMTTGELNAYDFAVQDKASQ